jgi:hypothetical protein
MLFDADVRVVARPSNCFFVLSASLTTSGFGHPGTVVPLRPATAASASACVHGEIARQT